MYFLLQHFKREKAINISPDFKITQHRFPTVFYLKLNSKN